MTGVGLRRPSRVVGIDHDSHPGLIGLPGSQSILAALPVPLDTRSPARETLPQPRLPGCPIRNPGFVASDGFLPGREPSGHVCSTRRDRTFFNDGCDFRACQISLRSELAGHPAQDCAQPFGSVAPLRIGVRHERQLRSDHDREAGEAFRVSGENVRECG